MRLRWGRESDVSTGRKLLSTSYRAMDQPKMPLGWSQWSHFSSGCKVLRTYFYLLTSTKFVFKKFEIARIQIVDWHFEVIFCFLTYRKSRKQCFEWSPNTWLFQLTFGLWNQPKIGLYWSQNCNFSSDCKELRTYFCLLTSPRCDFD